MTTETSHGYPAKDQPMQPYQTMSYADDEIDLRDVLATLWRRRKFICIGVLLIVLSAVAIVFTKPDVYRVKALVSPGILSREPGGKVTFTNSLENYKGQIDAGAYTMRLEGLLEDQHKDIRYSPKKLRASIPKKSSALLLSYDTTNQGFGKAVVGHLVTLMRKEDAGIVTLFGEGLQSGIKLDKKALTECEYQIAFISKQLDSLGRTKKDVQQQVGAAIKATKKYSADGVKSLVASAVSEESLYKALLYNNMVIQNRQVLSDLNKEIGEINSQIDSFATKRQSITELYREIQATVDESTRAVENIKPFQEIIPVMTEEGRVGPRRRLIVVMSFVSGVFLMILLTFFVEYLKPNE